jgi:hypothetical protein
MRHWMPNFKIYCWIRYSTPSSAHLPLLCEHILFLITSVHLDNLPRTKILFLLWRSNILNCLFSQEYILLYFFVAFDTHMYCNILFSIRNKWYGENLITIWSWRSIYFWIVTSSYCFKMYVWKLTINHILLVFFYKFLATTIFYIDYD